VSVNLDAAFVPRGYQQDLVRYVTAGGLRAVVVWHRRAGKDMTLWNILITMAWFHRVGTYYYFFPTYAQGKKVIWDGMDLAGRPYLSYIPEEFIAPNGRNETEMQVKLKNGSVIQIVGTDRYDSVRGTNCVGCIFSEYQDQDPQAFLVVEPILLANGGWAAFAYTPRGANHGLELFDFAKTEQGWFAQLLTIDDTQDEKGRPIVSAEQIASLRRRGVEEEFIQQEYYCSFSGIQSGSYFGKLLNAARQGGRLTQVPFNPRYPVFTTWDLGRDDQNAIWFGQHLGTRINLIDYNEDRHQGLDYYAGLVKARYPNYAFHVMPHDINVTEYSNNQRRIDAAYTLGLRPIRVAPKLSVYERIDAARRLLPICYFDAVKCKRGLQALENYHKKKDDKNHTFLPQPQHNWASNGADSFSYLAVDLFESDDATHPPGRVQEKADNVYSAYGDQGQAESEFNAFTG